MKLSQISNRFPRMQNLELRDNSGKKSATIFSIVMIIISNI